MFFCSAEIRFQFRLLKNEVAFIHGRMQVKDFRANAKMYLARFMNSIESILMQLEIGLVCSKHIFNAIES